MRKPTVSNRLAAMSAGALVALNGCTVVQPSDFEMFVRDFLLRATAAFLF